MVPGISEYSLSDVNECQDDDNQCDENAYCQNLDGGYRCTCKSGYYGLGTECLGTWNVYKEDDYLENINIINYENPY